jgi:hypothetical protein
MRARIGALELLEPIVDAHTELRGVRVIDVEPFVFDA